MKTDRNFKNLILQSTNNLSTQTEFEKDVTKFITSCINYFKVEYEFPNDSIKYEISFPDHAESKVKLIFNFFINNNAKTISIDFCIVDTTNMGRIINIKNTTGTVSFDVQIFCERIYDLLSENKSLF